VTSATSQSNIDTIDVRTLVPAQRHATIFRLVNELSPGGRFVLVNDHDPKPLYYQLEAEYPKQFSWTYLERGPDVWRVEIGKLKAACRKIPWVRARAKGANPNGGLNDWSLALPVDIVLLRGGAICASRRRSDDDPRLRIPDHRYRRA
jgi:uncharacterized protein (DUF2249 family)